MLVVIDTNVLLSAIRSRRGASRQVLAAVLLGLVPCAVSTTLLLEYEEILLRHGFAADAVRHVLDGLVSVAQQVSVPRRLRPYSSDPDDDFLIEAAVAARATAIVTYDVADLAPARALGIAVLRPVELLRQLEEG